MKDILKHNEFLLVCNEKESDEVCQIFNKFDKHREKNIKLYYVELANQNVSRRVSVGLPMVQIETKCFKVRHTTEFGYKEITTGTRYVYEGEILYNEIYKWYNIILRDNKLSKLLHD